MLFGAIRYFDIRIGKMVLTIAIDFVHILFRDPTDDALLNDLWILPADMFDNLEVFHRNLTSISKNRYPLMAKYVPRAVLLR